VILTALDWTVIAASALATLAVGLLFSRRGGRSVADYFASGRGLPWWLAGTSMVATSFAADTPLWITGQVRGGGVQANWYWWSFLFGHVVAVFVFARLWRRAEVLTNVEITEVRFSGRAAAALRLFKSVYLALPINLAVVVWCNVAMAMILEATTGISKIEGILACLAISAAFCLFSGLWGVVATDLFQLAIAFGGAVALCAAAVHRAGGLDGVRVSLEASGALDLAPTSPGPALNALIVFAGVLWWSSRNVDGGGALIQRMIACKGEKDAVKATMLFTVLHYAGRTWPWVLAGLASLILFPRAGGVAPGAPELAPYADAVKARGEFAYPAMVSLLPAGLRGLLVASLFAAYASTVNTFMNLSAAYILNDVYRRFVRREAPERHYVRVSRVLFAVFMAIAAAVTLLVDTVDQVFSFSLAFASGVGIVYVGRWCWWRVNAFSEIAAMVTSGAVAIYLTRAGAAWPGVLDPAPFRILVTAAASAAVALPVTLLTRPTDRARLIDFYVKVHPPGFWGPIRAEAARFDPRPPPRAHLSTLLAIAGSSALILGVTLGLGKLLLFGARASIPFAVLAAAGAGLLALAMRRGAAAGGLFR